ncbi:hypothetical protein DFH11DRAFT_1469190, partial [Phellopilus nigrolimitatus]
LKPRYGGRGLVMYVDNQLHYSKCFDVAGIEREHPELFVLFPRRQSSLVSMASGAGNGNDAEFQTNPEGQQR